MHGSGASWGGSGKIPQPQMIHGADIPCWSGDPTEFETYATACKWYQKGTKENERKLVVARLWSRLQGPAKSVVRHLDPDLYEGADGLSNFLEVLRASPLQQLPVPDVFSRLERWSQMKRHDREQISELLIREEELFTELQQALVRARKDRELTSSKLESREVPSTTVQPPSTPSRSPMHAGRSFYQSTNEQPAETSEPAPPTVPVAHVPGDSDFFGDELRGYRLLKACRLNGQERQNVLVQTGNSTHFQAIRRALRTLFSEDMDRLGTKHTGKVWWTDNGWDNGYDDESSYWWDMSPGSGASYDDGSYEQYWVDDYEWMDDSWGEEQWDESWEADEIHPDDDADGPEEGQLREAYAISTEAARTLKEAKEAVRKVRQARGYYAPESSSGKGMQFSGSSSSPRQGKVFWKREDEGKRKDERFWTLFYLWTFGTWISTMPGPVC